ncbi:MAG TPA: type III PLP-dependent enzyme [Candidatus Saccharimonadales bacterium]|nr:type III PLP-dependent enzyme [Candidatus Saccharimonadales bacterium]
MKITQQFLTKTKNVPTPFLMMDLDQVRKNYHRIQKSIDGVEVYYSIKANDHERIVETLAKENCSFDVSSLRELKLLMKIGVSAERIKCFHPIKNAEFLTELHKYGVDRLAADSLEEIDKIAKFAPKSKIVLRIIVDNEGSDWPLTTKFGIEALESIKFFAYAKKKGLEPYGLTFHVGSQCLNKDNWANAMSAMDDIWQKAEKEGMPLTQLSLGGGIPIQHIKKIPSVEEIGKSVNHALKNKFHMVGGRKLRVTIEPGRGLVGDAGIIGSTVVGKAKRGDESWIYVDAGVFNALMETVEGFQYEITTADKRKSKVTSIGGPSCDSVDIPFKNVTIPDVRIDERIYILNAGAYTTVYASEFNGFAPLKIYFLEE